MVDRAVYVMVVGLRGCRVQARQKKGPLTERANSNFLGVKHC